MNLELVTFAASRNTTASTLGIASVKFIDIGLAVHEIRIQRRGGGWYCARPSRFPVVISGMQLQHPEGNLIWRTMFLFDSDERFIQFSEKVVALVREKHPDFFTPEDAGVTAQVDYKPGQPAVPHYQEPVHA